MNPAGPDGEYLPQTLFLFIPPHLHFPSVSSIDPSIAEPSSLPVNAAHLHTRQTKKNINKYTNINTWLCVTVTNSLTDTFYHIGFFICVGNLKNNFKLCISRCYQWMDFAFRTWISWYDKHVMQLKVQSRETVQLFVFFLVSQKIHTKTIDWREDSCSHHV